MSQYLKALELARLKLKNQEDVFAADSVLYADALKKNMPATAKVLSGKLKRYEFAIALSREHVRELESVVGVLPLGKGGK